MLYLLIAVFTASLLIAVGASAFFTRRLEAISDLWHFSPGLLSLLGALGANIPNYVASLVAASSGQAGVGIGIIIGSNIYNVAVILGLAVFASPTYQGLMLSPQEAQDARLVGKSTLAMMVTTGLAAAFFSWKVSLHISQQMTLFASIALPILNLLALGLFCFLSSHAFRHAPEPYPPVKKAVETATSTPLPGRWLALRIIGEMTLALCIALGGVIVMVQTAQIIASDIHLPSAILSLIVLAVATSLPNTIVALTLARTNRAGACIEEVFSSNSVNAALGIAVPLLFWSGMQRDSLLIVLDGPLMVILSLAALLCVLNQRVSRVTGALLILVYVSWVVIHLFL